MVSLVCHRWHSVIELIPKLSLTKQILYFAKNDNFKVLDWYRYTQNITLTYSTRSKGMLNHINTCRLFVVHNLSPALQWAVTNKLPWTIECLELAIHNQYDNIINWLKENVWNFLNEEQRLELNLILDREELPEPESAHEFCDCEKCSEEQYLEESEAIAEYYYEIEIATEALGREYEDYLEHEWMDKEDEYLMLVKEAEAQTELYELEPDESFLYINK